MWQRLALRHRVAGLHCCARATALWCLFLSPLWAQSSTVSTPLNTASSGFFEQTGVGFGFQKGSFFFQQNSFGLAVPPFGGFTPGAGATFGFRSGSGWLNIAAGQGSRTGMVSQSPSLTLMNGASGNFFAGTVTPFVTSVTPVVGMGAVPVGAGSAGMGVGPWASPLQERLERLQSAPVARAASNTPLLPADDKLPAAPVAGQAAVAQRLAAAQADSAALAGLSVAEIQEIRAAGQSAAEQELTAIVAKARAAEAAGKHAVARIYYQQAARRSAEPQRAELLARAASLGQ